MYKKSIFLLFYCLLLVKTITYAQNSLVNVNYVTGTANVAIPLYTLNAAGVSFPIEATYSAKGIRALDVESNAGMGWNLVAGGAITREVRGLPDDAPGGCIANNNQSSINSLTLHSDNNYTDINSDWGTIIDAFGVSSDTEPDIFTVDAPGLSCQLVYDNTSSNKFRPIPYQDLKITTTSGTGITSGAFTSISITNDKGITYTFGAPELAFQRVVPPAPAASSVNFFKKNYNQYLNAVSYYSAWDLTSIKDQYGNTIQLSYIAGTKKGFTNAIDLTIATPTNAAQDALQYKLYGSNTPNLLSTITLVDAKGVSSNVFSFSWVTNSATYKDMISSITGNGRNFQFTYTGVNSSGSTFIRNYLKYISEPGCSSPVNYMFSYNNNTSLPDSTQSAGNVDLWGYYNAAGNTVAYPAIAINPSTSGLDRYRNYGTETLPSSYPYTMSGANMDGNGYAAYGSLSQIFTSDGGNTSLSYQANDYYDSLIGKNFMGAGIRISQITYYDAINTANNVVRNFSYYLNGESIDDNVASNGRPISLPIYAFTQPYTGTGSTANLWSYSTVRSSTDLSTEDHTILYSYVTESITGKGKTVYNFNIPATISDSYTGITTPLAWAPTTAVAGSTTTNTIGFLSNNINSYPFPPNLNYDFERGLISSIVNYNESGNEVNETDYTYQTPQTPITITGLKYDYNSTCVGYAKYNIYTSTTPLTTQVTHKLNDLNSTTATAVSTTNYTYSSTTDKLTEESITNSDNNIQNLYIKYSKDYTISPTGNDSFTQALYNLQQSNINIPVETYLQVKPANKTSFVTTKAELVKFGTLTGGTGVVPITKLAISASSTPPATDGLTSFTASSVASGVFNYDLGDYTVIENDKAYDYTGVLMSSDNNFGRAQSAVTDHTSYKPTYIFSSPTPVSNLSLSEVAFNDFDSNLTYNTNLNLFAGTGLSTISTTSRTGANSATLTANSVISATMNRNLAVQNFYIFSIWLQTTSTGTLSVKVTGGSVTNNATAFGYGNTSNLTSYPTGWEYCEVKVPMTGITSSAITISFSCNTATTVDDILAYPDVAQVATFAYDPLTKFKTAETNTNGVSNYYNNDVWGRLLYSFDQDKNILTRNQYAPGSTVALLTPPVLGGASSTYTNYSTTWTNSSSYSSCVSAGLTYIWDPGDNTGTTSTALTSSYSHTYTASGTYNLKLSVVSPLYGTVTTTKTITVAPVSQVSVSYSNTTNSPTISYIASVTFSQGGVVKYTFPTSELNGPTTLVPGVYQIDIHPYGNQYNTTTHNGYGSIQYTGNNSPCFNYASGDYIFTDDLTNTPAISFVIQIGTCGM